MRARLIRWRRAIRSWLMRRRAAPIERRFDGLDGEVVWIEADANPWDKRVLDCRPITGNLTSWTSDRKVAERFVSRTPDYGTRLVGRHPRRAKLLTTNLSYPMTSDPQDGPVFFSGEMEEKWDVFFYTDTIYIARSWTGDLTFRAHADLRGQMMLIAEAEIDARISSDPEFCRRVLDFIIKSHMYRWLVPAPVPVECADRPRAMAMEALSMYGWMAPLATTEDTIGTEHGSLSTGEEP